MKNKNIFVFLIIIMIMLIGYDSNGQIIKDTINQKQSLIEKNKEVIKNKVIQARSHQLTDIKPWYKPNYINVQYAGNIGFLSFGAGYFIFKPHFFSVDFVYGYAPSSKTAVDIHNIMLRLCFKMPNYNIFAFKQSQINLSWRPIFANIGISEQIHNSNTWKRLPKFYPKGYYPPNAFRIHLDIGTSAIIELNNKIAIEPYILTTTNDMYVGYYYTSRDNVHISDIFSAAIGANIIFYK